LAGRSNFVCWDTSVAAKVAYKAVCAVSASITKSSLKALAGRIVTVTTLLAHAVVRTSLRDTGVSLVALKAHAAV